MIAHLSRWLYRSGWTLFGNHVLTTFREYLMGELLSVGSKHRRLETALEARRSTSWPLSLKQTFKFACKIAFIRCFICCKINRISATHLSGGTPWHALISVGLFSMHFFADGPLDLWGSSQLKDQENVILKTNFLRALLEHFGCGQFWPSSTSTRFISH